MKKLWLLVPILLLMVLLPMNANAYTIANGTYTKTVSINAASYTYKSCNIQANYESGNCQYLYGAYVIIPKGSTDLSSAIQKTYTDITDTKSVTYNIVFIPPRGNRWALVSFLAVQNNTYNFTTGVWTNTMTIPLDYRSAYEIISLCPTGQMLRNVYCYPSRSVCVNQYGTNMCNNPYQLYVLDIGYGYRYNDASSFCADRSDDGVCDLTTSITCPDTNLNGVCDADDLYIFNATCIDANNNWVCDAVEGSGTFCRTNFNPVNCGSGASCITYPNSCFASASGCSTTTQQNGTCAPVYVSLCATNADCPPPCDGVSGQCKNPDGTGFRCMYAGECNPRLIQCSVDTDCPKSPCVGASFQCAANKCVIAGKCVTQPIQLTFWQQLAVIWNSFVAWVAGLFGW